MAVRIKEIGLSEETLLHGSAIFHSFCADTSDKMDDAEDIVTYEEAVKSDERRIVFTGPRR